MKKTPAYQFKQSLQELVHSSILDGASPHEIIGLLEIIKMALIRTIQDVSVKQSDEQISQVE